MKRPWQIWTLFVIGIAVVYPAMGWLTWKVIELDRAESVARQTLAEMTNEAQLARANAEGSRQQAEAARRRANQQRLIGNALWRMDTAIAPLMAQEAARPFQTFQSFYASSGKGKGSAAKVPSPILKQPSEEVNLHFTSNPDGGITSPQVPLGESCQLAFRNGLTQTELECNTQRLSELALHLDRTKLMAQLPTAMNPGQQLAAQSNPLWSDVLNGFNNDYRAGAQSNASSGQQKALPDPSQVPPNAVPQVESPPPANGPNSASQVSQESQQLAYGQQRFAPNTGKVMMRDDLELARRGRNVEYLAQNQVVQQNLQLPSSLPELKLVSEGISKPVWIGPEHLVLAKRMNVNGRDYIQGCWLNWKVLKQQLLDEVADLLPEADLVPVLPDDDADPTRMLATVPAQLVVANVQDDVAAVAAPAPISISDSTSPIRVSLWIAWSCLILATGAAAVMLQGVISLSERRGAFVSAVTHELRTPLTTFRMYAEMLAEGMVPSAEKRADYLNTLRVEANRLSHLVENVLQYARLERGRQPGRKRQSTTLEQLVIPNLERLRERAEQVDMSIEFDEADSLRHVSVRTDPAAVEQILFNLVDNACKYATQARDRRIHLRLRDHPKSVAIHVQDHGPGISAAESRRLFRPFSKSVQQAANSAPGVGLGLALCKRLAHDLGGQLAYESNATGGACFVLTLPK